MQKVVLGHTIGTSVVPGTGLTVQTGAAIASICSICLSDYVRSYAETSSMKWLLPMCCLNTTTQGVPCYFLLYIR